MDNLTIYNQVFEVPEEAQKQITGGRLNGMTDIKPMWRIEKLTEIFGPVGIGWYTETTKEEIIDGANDEKIAVVNINLFVNYKTPLELKEDLWSRAIEGKGGSSFIAKEKNGLYTSDECFKMAYTDALSVACKSLGMGAKVYWGDSKYLQKSEPTLEEAKNYKITFGKYKDETLDEINSTDPDYLDWLLENTQDKYLLKCLGLLIAEEEAEEMQNEHTQLILRLQELIVEKEVDLEKMLEYYEVQKYEELSTNQLIDLVKKLEKRKSKNILEKAEGKDEKNA